MQTSSALELHYNTVKRNGGVGGVGTVMKKGCNQATCIYGQRKQFSVSGCEKLSCRFFHKGLVIEDSKCQYVTYDNGQMPTECTHKKFCNVMTLWQLCRQRESFNVKMTMHEVT